VLNADDLTQMRADLLEVRDDNDVSIAIRRGGTTLSAQTVRIARTGRGGKRDSAGGQEVRADVIVLGGTTLDIQVDDRFTVSGVLYRVIFVRPNRTVAVMAECEAVE
jgi:hypothetical protein